MLQLTPTFLASAIVVVMCGWYLRKLYDDALMFIAMRYDVPESIVAQMQALALLATLSILTLILICYFLVVDAALSNG